ncbi:ARM repeat-containing protein [Leucogyrophana mollusca]|uniref:ARM repeat-containing protein n=1 Tax=Leucogyrophana mollusca TaxID=85980 RepID=A0ACB8BF74_9AGAM|nr:ARM repeat-containing protein [Leucogyrophana mollusca]
MTVRTITTTTLKRLKNSVIGNPSAKLALAQDSAFIHSLVSCLNHPPPSFGEAQGSQDDIRIEAAHVISSISYGSEEALASLLRANALQAFLDALSTVKPLDPPAFKPAFARGLRILSCAIADVVGPSQLGLRTWSAQLRAESKAALNYLLEFECLDTYLPLLASPSTQTSISIAQLIGSAIRCEDHRNAITDWLPLADRLKEVKGKRGWERPDMVNSTAPSRQGGWVVRNLITLMQKKDLKLQEAALSAIAALAKDNPPVAGALAKASPDRDAIVPLSFVLSLTKSRAPDVQLAASLCATHILRANASNVHPASVDQIAALNVIHVVNRMLASETPQHRIKACYTLYYLVTDEKDLCQEVFDRGTLDKIASLVKSITPLEKGSEWEEDEPESTISLREAALTAIATISLFDHEIKRDIADNLQLLPTIHVSLTHRNVGVRYAASQCVRALSRAVAVIRTNLMDTGVGLTVFQVFKKPDEDPRVTYAALLAVCNLVNDFSPLRPIFVEQGLLPRLMQLHEVGDTDLRINVLFAMKNLLRMSKIPLKRTTMASLTWPLLTELSADPEVAIQEQAFSILRNIAGDEPGVDFVFESMSEEALATTIITGLDSPHEDVTREAAFFLGNLANGSKAQQDLIFSHPHILQSMHICMADAKSETRCPIVSCVYELLAANPKRRHEFNEVGIISTLRHMCDMTSTVSVSPGGRFSNHHHIHTEADVEAARGARKVLDLLDRNGTEV